MNYQIAVMDEEIQGCFWALARRNNQVLTGMRLCKKSEYLILKHSCEMPETFTLLTFFSHEESNIKNFVDVGEMKEVFPNLYLYGNGV